MTIMKTTHKRSVPLKAAPKSIANFETYPKVAKQQAIKAQQPNKVQQSSISQSKSSETVYDRATDVQNANRGDPVKALNMQNINKGKL